MINGLDPILIFSFFKKLTPAEQVSLKNINIVSQFVKTLELPPIPIYLSEKLTGLYVDSESKNIDIETNVDTLASGGSPEFNQKGISSAVKVNLLANKDSIGLNILSAIADLILPLVTSKEYSVTYLNGATTVFGGLLHSFAVDQDSNSTLMRISFDLIKTKKGAQVTVPNDPNAATLNNSGSIPSGGSAPAPTGPGPGGGASIPLGRP